MIKEEVANLEEELSTLMLQYQEEKKQSDELAALRVQLEHKRWEVEKMEARYNLQVGLPSCVFALHGSRGHWNRPLAM